MASGPCCATRCASVVRTGIGSATRAARLRVPGATAIASRPTSMRRHGPRQCCGIVGSVHRAAGEADRPPPALSPSPPAYHRSEARRRQVRKRSDFAEPSRKHLSVVGTTLAHRRRLLPAAARPLPPLRPPRGDGALRGMRRGGEDDAGDLRRLRSIGAEEEVGIRRGAVLPASAEGNRVRLTNVSCFEAYPPEWSVTDRLDPHAVRRRGGLPSGGPVEPDARRRRLGGGGALVAR